jgi:hypothetical protein
MFNLTCRKSRQAQEKALRSIVNRANEKKILAMNFKMMARILSKVLINRKKLYLHDFSRVLSDMQLRKQAVQVLLQNRVRKAFL